MNTRRRAMALGTVAFLLIVAGARVNTAVPLIVQHVGNANPESEGFVRQPGISGVPTVSVGSFSAWQTTGTDPCCSFYHQALGVDEADYTAIMSRGWRLTSRLRVVSANSTPNYAIVGFFPIGPRHYDVIVQTTGADAVVRLFDAGPSPLTYTVPGGANRWLLLDLVYRPSTGTASLFIDGIERLSGYEGAPFNGPAYGLVFGGGGIVVNFNLVKFESPVVSALPNELTTDYAVWRAQAPAAVTTIDFEALPVGSILDGNEYVGLGLSVIQRDGHDIRVVAAGDGSFASAANFQSPTRGLSSSARPGFPFGYDGSQSENYDFLLTEAAGSAGLWVGNLNPGFDTVTVEFLDSAGEVIAARALTTGDQHLVTGGAGQFDNRVFVGLRSSTLIKRIRVKNDANDADGIIFDNVVFGINAAPLAGDSAAATLEDTPINGALYASDPNGDPLTFSLVSNGNLGTAIITDAQTGSFTYTPDPNISGVDVITFSVSDGESISNTATVTLTIGPVNDPPDALNESFSTIQNAPVTFTLGATDIDGPALTFSLVTGGAKGTVEILDAASGLSRYTPNPGASGTDTFSFRVSDGFEDDVANVSISIQADKITPTITWATPAGITYGTALGATQLNASTVGSIPGTFAYTPAAGTTLAAGTGQTLSVLFTPDDTNAYTTATSQVLIDVARAPLTVAANNASKFFGAPLPPFNATFIGFVNGDSPSNLSGTLVLSTSATATSPPGPYSIVPSGVSSSNYTIAFVPGTLTIARANTTTTLQVLPGTTGYLQANALIAMVAPIAPGAGAPAGTVQFMDGATLIGSGIVSGGQAYILANGLASGIHSLTAVYAGNSNFAGSSSPSGTATVRPISSSTFTILTTTRQAVGLPATLTAKVTQFGGGTPTGTVQFREGTTILGSAPLVSLGPGGVGSVATLNTRAITAGTHVLIAQYSGNATLAKSVSPPAAITIYPGARPAPTAVAVVPSPSPLLLGQPVTYTATVIGGATTGNVIFYANGLFQGVAPIANIGGSFKATMTLTTPPLSIGVHVVSAVYVGSVGFASSSSAPAVLRIQASPSLTEEPLDDVTSLIERK